MGTEQRIPLLEGRPCSTHVALCEESVGRARFLDEVAPDDVGGAIEDSVEIETAFVQSERTSIGPPRSRGGGEKGPGHDEREAEEGGEPANMLTESAGMNWNSCVRSRGLCLASSNRVA